MICKNCLKDTLIVNKHFMLCFKCNNERLNKNKVNIPKNKNNVKKHTQNDKKPKDTRERDMFLEIWEERPHYCSNISCGRFLGSEPKAIYFSHRKAKSIRPDLRLEKDNVDIFCSDCHYLWDFGDKSKVIINDLF